MSISIRYSLRRSEVWALYGRLWRQRLWKIHALVFLAVAGSLAFSSRPVSFADWLIVVGAGLVPIILFALYPMLMFKPQERVLTVSDAGVETSIGRHEKSLPWSEVASVQNSDGAILIQRQNLNAFIVPARAFDSLTAQEAFETFIREHLRRA